MSFCRSGFSLTASVLKRIVERRSGFSQTGFVLKRIVGRRSGFSLTVVSAAFHSGVRLKPDLPIAASSAGAPGKIEANQIDEDEP